MVVKVLSYFRFRVHLKSFYVHDLFRDLFHSWKDYEDVAAFNSSLYCFLFFVVAWTFFVEYHFC